MPHIRLSGPRARLATAPTNAGNVRLCPGPDERYRSPFYQVEVDGAGPAFVYHHENGWKKVPDTVSTGVMVTVINGLKLSLWSIRLAKIQSSTG